jgi:AcrR family transcriptional regulator
MRSAERTQRALLAAAETEFAEKGLAGARVDLIAGRSGTNKRMLYYYFGSKEKLYLAVLEQAYTAMRKAERELNLTRLDPLEAIKTLVEFKFNYFLKNSTIIPLLAGENMLGAKYLKRSQRLGEMHLSLIKVLHEILSVGEKNGVLKPGIDPLHLYMSISALSYFYFSNSSTLSTVFGRDLASPAERKLRQAHAVEVILDSVRLR